MTQTDYTKHTEQVLRYVGGLLLAREGSTTRRIGREFMGTDVAGWLAFADELMDTNPETTREYEIGWDLWAIMHGVPESEAAA